MWNVDEITYPELTTPTRIDSSQPPGREVTADMLTTNGVPWNVSPDDRPSCPSAMNTVEFTLFGSTHSAKGPVQRVSSVQFASRKKAIPPSYCNAIRVRERFI
jgi:hypothetical protein